MTARGFSKATVAMRVDNDDARAALTVLLGEHDYGIRAFLAFILRAEGHEVCEATDGATMLEKLASLFNDDSRTFDLVIAEQRMPFMPGLPILAGMRSSGRHTPFILVTDDPFAAHTARQLGAITLGTKSTVDAFRAAVRQSRGYVVRNGAGIVKTQS
jgi:CheY-like chemotaxis protein